jgi:hypothetical protein
VSGQHEEVSSLLEKATARGEQLGEKSECEFFTESHQRISGLIAKR